MCHWSFVNWVFCRVGWHFGSHWKWVWVAWRHKAQRYPHYFLKPLKLFKTGVPVLADHKTCRRLLKNTSCRRGLALQSRLKLRERNEMRLRLSVCPVVSDSLWPVTHPIPDQKVNKVDDITRTYGLLLGHSTLKNMEMNYRSYATPVKPGMCQPRYY